MSRYPGVAALLERASSQSREQKNADAIGRKAQAVARASRDAKSAGSKARQVDSRVPRDDGVAPLAPSNVTAVATLGRQIDLSWSDAPDSDYVTHTIVEITPSGETARQIRGTAHTAYATDLPAKLHSFRVRFVDRWGRLGAWSPARTATPKKSVAEYVDFQAAEIAGALGWANLAALDANSGLTLAQRQAKLGQDVVTASAMATQNLAATRLWVQSAAIESAMIRELSVDKLTAGTFTAGQITLAGNGVLSAGQTKVSSSGIFLSANSEVGAPADEPSSKISVPGLYSSYGFFNAGGGSTRGAGITALGNNGNTGAAIVLRSSYNATYSNGDPYDASLEVQSYRPGQPSGYIYCRPNLTVDGDLFVERASQFRTGSKFLGVVNFENRVNVSDVLQIGLLQVRTNRGNFNMVIANDGTMKLGGY